MTDTPHAHLAEQDAIAETERKMTQEQMRARILRRHVAYGLEQDLSCDIESTVAYCFARVVQVQLESCPLASFRERPHRDQIARCFEGLTDEGGEHLTSWATIESKIRDGQAAKSEQHLEQLGGGGKHEAIVLGCVELDCLVVHSSNRR